MSPDTIIAASVPDETYGPGYYATHCGPVPYARTEHWLGFFGRVADELVRAFAPRRVFDAGCAMGLLVECLWDRAVEAHGRDVSTFAIGQVRADVRPCCEVGSIADPIEGDYDLLTCIEVLEHMPEAEALRAIAAMAAAAPRILFSSSPTDLDEPTHCNVRPTAYWLARWAEAGFAPMQTHDATYLAPHAFMLERSETGRAPRDLAAFAGRVRDRVALAQANARLGALVADLAAEKARAMAAEGEAVRVRAESARLRAASAQRAAEARAEAAEMRDAAERERSRAEAAERGAALSRAEMLEAQDAWRNIALERDRLQASVAWRALRPLRAVATRLPRPVRALARRVLGTA
jgi:chemotaxis protein histidine kinase CheA